MDIHFRSTPFRDFYVQSRLRTTDLVGEEDERLIASSAVASASSVSYVSSLVHNWHKSQVPLIYLSNKIQRNQVCDSPDVYLHCIVSA